MVNAKFGGMYASFFRALDEYGNHAILTHDIVNAQADVLVVPMGGGQEYDSLQAIRRFTGPVVLYVPPASMWFDPDLLSRLQGKVLFAYGTDASTFSPQSYSRLGIRYHCIPFASDPEIMKPLNIPRLFDIVFVGSLDHAPHPTHPPHRGVHSAYSTMLRDPLKGFEGGQALIFTAENAAHQGPLRTRTGMLPPKKKSGDSCYAKIAKEK